MTKETVEKITARYVARLADAPAGSDDVILHDFITELARDTASAVFLAARNEIDGSDLASLPEGERAELSSRLDAFAAVVGCDFALKVRTSLFPEGTDEPITDAERFAGSAYWHELQILLRTADKAGGRA